MDDFDKQMDRQQKCKLLADFINENYVGKVCEVQNVFLEKGRRVPYIGIVNKATTVLTRQYDLPSNIYVAIEIRTVISMYNMGTEFPMNYKEICGVCIPPIPCYIQTTCNDIADVVLKMDKTWKKMRKMINSVVERHIEYHKHDGEVGEEWQIKESYEQNEKDKE